MRIYCLIAGLLLASSGSAETPCSCDVAHPETLTKRECSLCVEAEKQPASPAVFFVKDNNPRKANRMLAIPRFHTPGLHLLADFTPEQRTELWTASIEKAKSLWGADWAIAYNGDRVRTQCHAHVHIGQLLPGVETDNFIVVNSPAEIPVPQGDGFWIHGTADNKLHVHTGEQINETVLLR
jgi:hypothetical protein